ncbi:Peptidase M15A [Desulforamulus reducens MI-1]|uniref:Peptidase M15A n=1 Tax=Desulforamulus reducens (strain ATCC BAA-1160 / DSM 100696 / MI-1) TaxID=349161 RepID=A4J1V3_DESRM|nr:D-Ala-D-Ala carboxypeptidase family metallohydrolase [Desulforamulus reducens]ABO49056.1 Peptidase M15A [Desulforamulus reducens MI-1]
MEVIKKAREGQYLSAHFAETELACRCCGKLVIHLELVYKLEDLRRLLDKPVLVNSGYRCPTNNRAVGGVVNSFHSKGMAADIRVPRMAVKEIAHLAEKVGFGGIGIYASQVHVDVRDYRTRWEG